MSAVTPASASDRQIFSPDSRSPDAQRRADAGVVRTANPAADRLFGSEPGRLAGAPVSELLAEISWSYAAEALRANRADDGQTLFIAAAEWHGMEAAMRDGPGQTGRLLAAPGQPAPHAGHP